jgi:3-phenylpropionate/trans-cinnamate dioxygenase ferredoxin component
MCVVRSLPLFAQSNGVFVMEFVRVASANAIAPGAALVVEVAGEEVLLANINGSFYAIGNICSHAYARLSDGYLDQEDCTAECPLHGSLFDLRTGQPRTLPAFEPVPVYAVRVEGDDLLLAPPA